MARPPLFQRATVTRIVKETDDARTYVLAPHDGPFTYKSGQFCTFKVTVDGTDLYRSYSMSSAPETDTELMTTVKRVPGGAVSNWLHDHVAEGDEVEITRPAGTFLLRPAEGPVLGFAGGSGITPILSLAKSALASTDRRVRLLIADRDRASAIFETVTADLVARYPGRFDVVRHYDDESGLLDHASVAAFVGPDTAADSYLCGPEPFMDMIEGALTGPGNVYSERFGSAAEPIRPDVPVPRTSRLRTRPCPPQHPLRRSRAPSRSVSGASGCPSRGIRARPCSRAPGGPGWHRRSRARQGTARPASPRSSTEVRRCA